MADNTVTTRIPPQLIRSDTHGKGAAEIGWGSHGDWDRCKAFLRRHGVSERMLDGACANLHKLATGEWPGRNAHKGAHALILEYLTAAATPGYKAIPWRGKLAPIGSPTGDGRIFPPNILKYQSFPQALRWQKQGSRGHDGAVTVAVIQGAKEMTVNGEPGIYGYGYFLDPDVISEVREALHQVEHGVTGPSVDLDSYTAALRKHPTNGKAIHTLQEGRMRAATLVPIPAFADLRIELGEPGTSFAPDGLVASVQDFAVNGDTWQHAQVAPREALFDADDAVSRIEAWANGDPAKMASAFLWVNTDNGPLLGRQGYRLPWADIVDGKPMLIYHAVYAAAALLQDAHGGLPNIPDGDKMKLRSIISEIYQKLANEFNDPTLAAPWDRRDAQADGEVEEFTAELAALLEADEWCDCECVECQLIDSETFDAAELEEFRGRYTEAKHPRDPRKNKHAGEWVDVPGHDAHGRIKIGGKWAYPPKKGGRGHKRAEHEPKHESSEEKTRGPKDPYRYQGKRRVEDAEREERKAAPAPKEETKVAKKAPAAKKAAPKKAPPVKKAAPAAKKPEPKKETPEPAKKATPAKAEADREKAKVSRAADKEEKKLSRSELDSTLRTHEADKLNIKGRRQRLDDLESKIADSEAEGNDGTSRHEDLLDQREEVRQDIDEMEARMEANERKLQAHRTVQEDEGGPEREDPKAQQEQADREQADRVQRREENKRANKERREADGEGPPPKDAEGRGHIGKAIGASGTHDEGRTRQRHVDRARAVAGMAAEMDELDFGEMGLDESKKRMKGFTDRHKGQPGGEDLAELNEKLQGAKSTSEMSRIAADFAESHGLKRTSRAGKVVPFDRAKHKPIGESHRQGQKVSIVRPGYTVNDGDNDITLHKSMVEEAFPDDELSPPDEVVEKAEEKVADAVDDEPKMTDAEKMKIRRDVIGEQMRTAGMLDGDRGKLWDGLSDEQKDRIIDQAVDVTRKLEENPEGRIALVDTKTGKEVKPGGRTAVAKKAPAIEATTPAEHKERLGRFKTREEARSYLDGVKGKNLIDLENELGWGHSGTVGDRRDRIVERTVGARLNSEAIRSGDNFDKPEDKGKTVVAKKAAPGKKSTEDHIKALDSAENAEAAEKYLVDQKLTNAQLKEIIEARGSKPTSGMTKAQLTGLAVRGARMRDYKKAVDTTFERPGEKGGLKTGGPEDKGVHEIRLPNGDVAKRTSKTRKYTHGLLVTRDNEKYIADIEKHIADLRKQGGHEDSIKWYQGQIDKAKADGPETHYIGRWSSSEGAAAAGAKDKAVVPQGAKGYKTRVVKVGDDLSQAKTESRAAAPKKEPDEGSLRESVDLKKMTPEALDDYLKGLSDTELQNLHMEMFPSGKAGRDQVASSPRANLHHSIRTAVANQKKQDAAVTNMVDVERRHTEANLARAAKQKTTVSQRLTLGLVEGRGDEGISKTDKALTPEARDQLEVLESAGLLSRRTVGKETRWAINDYGKANLEAHAEADGRGPEAPKAKTPDKPLDVRAKSRAAQARAESRAAAPKKEAQAEQMVRDAHAELQKRPGEWVRLADVRKRLSESGMSRDTQDETLKRMATQEGVQIIPWDNKNALDKEDRDAALRFGGQDNHAIRIESSGTKEEAPESRAAAPKGHDDASVEKSVRDLVAEQTKGRGIDESHWVDMADVRDRLDGLGIPRDQQDKVLKEMAHQADVRIIPLADTKNLSQKDKDSALKIGVTDNHVLEIGHQERAAQRNERARQLERKDAKGRTVVAKKAAPKPQVDVKAQAEEFKNLRSREKAREFLKDIQKKDLVPLAAEVGMPHRKSDNAQQIRDALIRYAGAGEDNDVILGRAHERRGAVERAAAPRGDNPKVEAARERQAGLTKASEVADVIAEVDEMRGAEADLDVAKRRVAAKARRYPDNEQVQALAKKVAAADSIEEMDTAARGAHKGAGLQPMGRAGEIVAFDPAKHKAIGKAPAKGTKVTVVRPGHTVGEGNDRLQLTRADVAEVSAREIAAEHPKESPAAKKAEAMPEKTGKPESGAGGKVTPGKRSAKPRLDNHWGGVYEEGQAYAHPDGQIPGLARSLGAQGAQDVDGDRLDNVLDQIATDTVLGKTTGDEQVEALRKLAARLPDGPVKNAILGTADELDAPKRPVPDSMKGAPKILSDLMDELLKYPLARGGSDADRSGQHASYVDALDQLMKDWHAGKISAMSLPREFTSRVYNRRHESYEGKVPIDRLIGEAATELDRILRTPGGRDILTSPARRQGTGGQ